MTIQSNDVVVVSKRWDHHTKSGGFDRLGPLLSDHVIARKRLGFLTRVWRRLFKSSWRAPEHLIDYRYADSLAEMDAMTQAAGSQRGIVHFLYGDEQMHLSLEEYRRSDVMVVATFHLPFSCTRKRFVRWEDRLRRGLVAGTAVSSELAEEINTFIGDQRITYIPHGIDTEVFVPRQNHSSKDRLQVIMVGENFRHFALMVRIIKACRQERWPIDFTYVAPRQSHYHFQECEGVILRSNLNEADFVSAYQDADVLLLPVKDATANNSLLEAIACGLPVISTDCRGIADYLDRSAGWLLSNNNAGDWIELLGHLSRDRTMLAEKRAKARELALGYGWQAVAKRYRNWYASI